MSDASGVDSAGCYLVDDPVLHSIDVDLGLLLCL